MVRVEDGGLRADEGLWFGVDLDEGVLSRVNVALYPSSRVWN